MRGEAAAGALPGRGPPGGARGALPARRALLVLPLPQDGARAQQQRVQGHRAGLHRSVGHKLLLIQCSCHVRVREV